MGNVGFDLVCFLDDLHAQHLLAEVAFVEFAIEDYFVKMLQLAECELFRQQLETNGLVLHFGSHAVVSCAQN